MPKEMLPNRPWIPGNNPKTAVWEYLKTHSACGVDKGIQHKLLITLAPDGYLNPDCPLALKPVALSCELAEQSKGRSWFDCSASSQLAATNGVVCPVLPNGQSGLKRIGS